MCNPTCVVCRNTWSFPVSPLTSLLPQGLDCKRTMYSRIIRYRSIAYSYFITSYSMFRMQGLQRRLRGPWESPAGGLAAMRDGRRGGDTNTSRSNKPITSTTTTTTTTTTTHDDDDDDDDDDAPPTPPASHPSVPPLPSSGAQVIGLLLALKIVKPKNVCPLARPWLSAQLLPSNRYS